MKNKIFIIAFFVGACLSFNVSMVHAAPTTQLIMDACSGLSENDACAVPGVFAGTCKKVPTKTSLYCNDPANPANNATVNPANSSPTAPSVGGGTSFTNPLRFNNVEEFVGGLLSAIQKIIVSLALVFIVIGALLYITAGANPDNAENGKKAIVAALIGLAIGVAAPSLLKEIGNTIGWNGVASSSVAGAPGLSDIAINILNFLLGILGILSLIMLVIGASMYLTSAGNEDRIDTGKDIFKYSLYGVIIAMSSMVLVRQIAAFFVN